jgi:hypothetical protein
MGRTIPSASILLMQEQANFIPFKRALASRDQKASEELYIYANLHVAEAAFAAFWLPMETFMLAIILEMYKKVIYLRNELENIVKGI